MLELVLIRRQYTLFKIPYVNYSNLLSSTTYSLQTESEYTSITFTKMSSGNSLGDQIKSGVKGIHGIGEAIRGTAMAETDKAFNTQSAETTKNEGIANKGVNQMKAADQTVGHNHGIKNTSTTQTTTGAPNAAPTTSAGAHSTPAGNIGSTGSTVGGPTGVQEQPGTTQQF